MPPITNLNDHDQNLAVDGPWDEGHWDDVPDDEREADLSCSAIANCDFSSIFQDSSNSKDNKEYEYYDDNRSQSDGMPSTSNYPQSSHPPNEERGDAVTSIDKEGGFKTKLSREQDREVSPLSVKREEGEKHNYVSDPTEAELYTIDLKTTTEETTADNKNHLNVNSGNYVDKTYKIEDNEKDNINDSSYPSWFGWCQRTKERNDDEETAVAESICSYTSELTEVALSAIGIDDFCKGTSRRISSPTPQTPPRKNNKFVQLDNHEEIAIEVEYLGSEDDESTAPLDDSLESSFLQLGEEGSVQEIITKDEAPEIERLPNSHSQNDIGQPQDSRNWSKTQKNNYLSAMSKRATEQHHADKEGGKSIDISPEDKDPQCETPVRKNSKRKSKGFFSKLKKNTKKVGRKIGVKSSKSATKEDSEKMSTVDMEAKEEQAFKIESDENATLPRNSSVSVDASPEIETVQSKEKTNSPSITDDSLTGKKKSVVDPLEELGSPTSVMIIDDSKGHKTLADMGSSYRSHPVVVARMKNLSESAQKTDERNQSPGEVSNSVGEIDGSPEFILNDLNMDTFVHETKPPKENISVEKDDREGVEDCGEPGRIVIDHSPDEKQLSEGLRPEPISGNSSLKRLSLKRHPSDEKFMNSTMYLNRSRLRNNPSAQPINSILIGNTNKIEENEPQENQDALGSPVFKSDEIENAPMSVEASSNAPTQSSSPKRSLSGAARRRLLKAQNGTSIPPMSQFESSEKPQKRTEESRYNTRDESKNSVPLKKSSTQESNTIGKSKNVVFSNKTQAYTEVSREPSDIELSRNNFESIKHRNLPEVDKNEQTATTANMSIINQPNSTEKEKNATSNQKIGNKNPVTLLKPPNALHNKSQTIKSRGESSDIKQSTTITTAAAVDKSDQFNKVNGRERNRGAARRRLLRAKQAYANKSKKPDTTDSIDSNVNTDSTQGSKGENNVALSGVKESSQNEATTRLNGAARKRFLKKEAVKKYMNKGNSTKPAIALERDCMSLSTEDSNSIRSELISNNESKSDKQALMSTHHHDNTTTVSKSNNAKSTGNIEVKDIAMVTAAVGLTTAVIGARSHSPEAKTEYNDDEHEVRPLVNDTSSPADGDETPKISVSDDKTNSISETNKNKAFKSRDISYYDVTTDNDGDFGRPRLNLDAFSDTSSENSSKNSSNNSSEDSSVNSSDASSHSSEYTKSSASSVESLRKTNFVQDENVNNDNPKLDKNVSWEPINVPSEMPMPNFNTRLLAKKEYTQQNENPRNMALETDLSTCGYDATPIEKIQNSKSISDFNNSSSTKTISNNFSGANEKVTSLDSNKTHQENISSSMKINNATTFKAKETDFREQRAVLPVSTVSRLNSQPGSQSKNQRNVNSTRSALVNSYSEPIKPANSSVHAALGVRPVVTSNAGITSPPRRVGAAQKRLQRAKEVNSSSKGWFESIKIAAARNSISEDEVNNALMASKSYDSVGNDSIGIDVKKSTIPENEVLHDAIFSSKSFESIASSNAPAGSILSQKDAPLDVYLKSASSIERSFSQSTDDSFDAISVGSALGIKSVVTTSSTKTVKRRGGTAKKRLDVVKNSNVSSNVGWIDSIKMVADEKMPYHTWDPENGWVPKTGYQDRTAINDESNQTTQNKIKESENTTNHRSVKLSDKIERFENNYLVSQNNPAQPYDVNQVNKEERPATQSLTIEEDKRDKYISLQTTEVNSPELEQQPPTFPNNENQNNFESELYNCRDISMYDVCARSEASSSSESDSSSTQTGETYDLPLIEQNDDATEDDEETIEMNCNLTQDSPARWDERAVFSPLGSDESAEEKQDLTETYDDSSYFQRKEIIVAEVTKDMVKVDTEKVNSKDNKLTSVAVSKEKCSDEDRLLFSNEKDSLRTNKVSEEKSRPESSTEMGTNLLECDREQILHGYSKSYDSDDSSSTQTSVTSTSSHLEESLPNIDRQINLSNIADETLNMNKQIDLSSIADETLNMNKQIDLSNIADETLENNESKQTSAPSNHIEKAINQDLPRESGVYKSKRESVKECTTKEDNENKEKLQSEQDTEGSKNSDDDERISVFSIASSSAALGALFQAMESPVTSDETNKNSERDIEEKSESFNPSESKTDEHGSDKQELDMNMRQKQSAKTGESKTTNGSTFVSSRNQLHSDTKTSQFHYVISRNQIKDRKMVSEEKVNNKMASEEKVNNKMASEEKINDEMASEEKINDKMASVEKISDEMASEEKINNKMAKAANVNTIGKNINDRDSSKKTNDKVEIKGESIGVHDDKFTMKKLQLKKVHPEKRGSVSEKVRQMEGKFFESKSYSNITTSIVKSTVVGDQAQSDKNSKKMTEVKQSQPLENSSHSSESSCDIDWDADSFMNGTDSVASFLDGSVSVSSSKNKSETTQGSLSGPKKRLSSSSSKLSKIESSFDTASTGKESYDAQERLSQKEDELKDKNTTSAEKFSSHVSNSDPPAARYRRHGKYPQYPVFPFEEVEVKNNGRKEKENENDGEFTSVASRAKMWMARADSSTTKNNVDNKTVSQFKNESKSIKTAGKIGIDETKKSQQVGNKNTSLDISVSTIERVDLEDDREEDDSMLLENIQKVISRNDTETRPKHVDNAKSEPRRPPLSPTRKEMNGVMTSREYTHFKEISRPKQQTLRTDGNVRSRRDSNDRRYEDEESLESNDSLESQEEFRRRKSFFERMTQCAAQTQAILPRLSFSGDESDDLPTAHMAFLRKNPIIVNDGSSPNNSVSRFNPTRILCNRPGTIREEDDDNNVEDWKGSRPSSGLKRSKKKKPAPSYVSDQSLNEMRGSSYDEEHDSDDSASINIGSSTINLELIAQKAAGRSRTDDDASQNGASSTVSSTAKSGHSEAWQAFLARKAAKGRQTHSRRSSDDGSKVSQAAEKYAQDRVEEMMKAMSQKSRNDRFRSPEESMKERRKMANSMVHSLAKSPSRNSPTVRNVASSSSKGTPVATATTTTTTTTTTTRQTRATDGGGRPLPPKSRVKTKKQLASAKAAEALAAARVEAMMAAMSSANLDEKEI